MLQAIRSLLAYAVQKRLATPEDIPYLENQLRALLQVDGDKEPDLEGGGSLPEVLDVLTSYAASKGLLLQDSPTGKDLFDTKIMGLFTPLPSQIRRHFEELYRESPKKATDWFYKLNQDINYIRRDRIAKDEKWVTPTQYGDLDITINLSKPEKDPKAIAAARSLPPSSYPKCQLCRENEGYAGRLDHPARQNLRLIPLTLCGESWFLQYSPYVYYNEHCIVLSGAHEPMKINEGTFLKLLSFVTQFPHYFIGSNADLPIVGGSILSHEHFQGGRYTFAMERAGVSAPVTFRGYEEIEAGILRWPMSVLRLRGKDAGTLAELSARILSLRREYSDETLDILSHSGEEPHNTITPIARVRDGELELDLVLRNNRTTPEHPLGIFHPHKELHHIKKENIGLIEVMGLAVLPSRLKEELEIVEERLIDRKPLEEDERSAKHAAWVRAFSGKYPNFPGENVGEILRREVGLTFATVLEHAGVFKQDSAGQEGFLRFVSHVNRELP